MTRSDRLQPIADLAGRKSDNAARALGDARGRLAGEEARLKQLQSWRDDYRARYECDTGLKSWEPQAMREYHAFLARLDDAIRQQAAKLLDLKAEYDRARSTWTESHSRTLALDHYVDRLKQGERRVALRREEHEHLKSDKDRPITGQIPVGFVGEPTERNDR